MITDRRNRLAAEIVEASECTNSWSRAGLLAETGVEIAEIDENFVESDMELME